MSVLEDSLLETPPYEVGSNRKTFLVKLLTLFGLLLVAFAGYSLYIYLPYHPTTSPAFTTKASFPISIHPRVAVFGINTVAFPLHFGLDFDPGCVVFLEKRLPNYRLFTVYNFTQEVCNMTMSFEYSLPEGLNKDIVIAMIQGLNYPCMGDMALFSEGVINGDDITLRTKAECKIISGLDQQNIYVAASFNSFMSQRYNAVLAVFFCLTVVSVLWQVSYNVVNLAYDWLNDTRTVKRVYLKKGHLTVLV